MNSHLVSVIMPMYNAGPHLNAAVQSVLDQTYDALELIIIDDGSMDDAKDQIKAITDPRIRLFGLEKNSGAGVARNFGIEKAKGQYIAFLDADDLWLPNKLEVQIKTMREKQWAFTYTDYFITDEKAQFLYCLCGPEWVDFHRMRRNNYIGCLTAVYDASLLGKTFMSDRRKRQDWTLWLRLLQKTPKAHRINTPLAAYRRSAASLSSKKPALLRENFNIYRQELGYSYFKSTLFLIRFLLYYSWHKLTSKKSID